MQTINLRSVHQEPLRIIRQEPKFTTERQTLAYAELKGVADVLREQFDAWSTGPPGDPIREITDLTISVDLWRVTMIRSAANESEMASAMRHISQVRPIDNLNRIRPLSGAARERYMETHTCVPTPEETTAIISQKFARFAELMRTMG